MVRIITIWGNSGSGKTTFACLLARLLTQNKKKAIIISPDMETPLLPIAFPGENIETVMSLGNILSATTVDNALVASKVVLYKPYPFVGMLAYSTGETPLSYPEIDYEKVSDLISAASSLVDYLILDCTSSVVSPFTPAAIEAANVVVRILTPDLFGLRYLEAHKPLLRDSRFHFSEHITLAGQARPFQAIEEMGHLVGSFSGILPYNKEIQRSGTCGEMFSALHCCGPKYTAALNTVAELVASEDDYVQEVDDDEQYE